MSALDPTTSPTSAPPPAGPSPASAGAATTARFRAAAEAGDIDGVLATLAPDVVLRSPITNRVVFHGQDEMRELLEVVYSTFSGVRYTDDLGDDRTRALFMAAEVGRAAIEEAMHVTLDDAGQIAELKLFVRPLSGLATMAAALGPKITARRHGPVRAVLARLALAPLAAMTRIGDRFIRFFA